MHSDCFVTHDELRYFGCRCRGRQFRRLLESLEQLRVLENGHRIAIDVAQANLPPGVDTQADLDRLNAMPVSAFE